MTRRPSGREPVASPLWTVAEASTYLRRGRTWVLEHQAELGAVRAYGRLQGFTQAGLDAWIAAHQPRPKPVAAPMPMNPLTGKPFLDLVGLPPMNPLTGKAWTVGDAR